MRKILSDLTLLMKHLFVFTLRGMLKRLPNMIFAFSIRHGSRAGNMGYKIISSVNRFAFGDAPD